MPVEQQTAEREYEKNPDIKREDIVLLQQWLEKQPHLPRMSEFELILFYHSCENSIEFAKTTIDTYYTLRTQLKEDFSNRDPADPTNAACLERILFALLPMTTPEGYKVMYCRLLDYEPTHVLFKTACKVFSMINDLYQYENGTHAGFIVLVDMDKMVLAHLGRVTITEIKHSLQYLQEAMPVRLKGFHFLNTAPFMDTVLAMMKPFMTKHFSDMLNLHPTPIQNTLFKHVPKEILPKELGGTHDPYIKIRDDTIAWINDNRDFFRDEEKRRVDESKRPGKPKDTSNEFGVDGSFKKLNFD